MADDAKQADPQAAPAPPLPPIAAKARDLEALRNAVIDAANVSGALWFSYLLVLIYLIIAVGSVSHRVLLFESPVKLPVLNVDLPLLGFFTLGPLIFLVVHAYVLLHFAMLADKIGTFHAELQAQIDDAEIRTQLRRQLPSNIFVQFLAGPPDLRSGLMGWILRLIAFISLVIGPLALLVLFVLQFLAYHHEIILWWQRIAVMIDLALLWALWPSIGRGETSAIALRDFRKGGVLVGASLTALTLLLVFTVATFPGEWLHRNRISIPFIPQFGEETMRVITAHEFLVAGDIDLIARRTTSIWSNRLVLPNLEQPPDNFSLRGRNLVGAILLGARLSKVDFAAANLQGATLVDSDLRDAKFGCDVSRIKAGERFPEVDADGDVVGRCTQLQSASFDRAQMQGVQFDGALMEGTTLRGAQLQRASLKESELHRANLELAQLQGAVLDEAILTGARLHKAKLHGASLKSANLVGASLDEAQLQGASLEDAFLDAASLDSAQLQGVSLSRASLRGASLRGALLLGGEENIPAQLQGAQLDGASLQAALLEKTMLWRSDPRPADLVGAVVRAPQAASKYQALDCYYRDLDICDWSFGTYGAIKQLIETEVPDGAYRKWALERIAALDPGYTKEEEKMAQTWSGSEASSPSDEDYQQRLADQFKYAICGRDYGDDAHPQAALYAARGLLQRLFPDREKPEEAVPQLLGSEKFGELATALLDNEICKGAQGLDGTDLLLLRRFAKSPANPRAALKR
jgi:uncharacterized protein YjbI with pentapeptide repeats